MDMVGGLMLLTAAAGIGGTGLGGGVAALLRRESSATVSVLLSFAAGVMTSVVCFDLLVDALEAESTLRGGIWMVLAGVLLGYGVISVLNAWVERRKLPVGRGGKGALLRAGGIMAAAIALHNMPEGMVIGASFAVDGQWQGALLLSAVIALHNIPEGMAVAVALLAGGMGRLRAVGLTALSGAPTVAGALLGYGLGTMGPMALGLSLSFASGAMLYVIFGELLPEANWMWRSKKPSLAAVLGLLTGVVIVYGG